MITSRLRNEDGNILITVVLVSMLVGALASLTLTTGEQADRSSARDRNSDIALGVAEAGVHRAIAQIEAQIPTTFVGPFSIDDGTTPEGSYRVDVDRIPGGFVIDSWGTVGGSTLERTRHVKVTMLPPPLFPDAQYALFSSTNIDLKNNDKVFDGDVWANDSLIVRQGGVIDGSITSAQSWIQLENGTHIFGNAWSGGFNGAGWAIDHGGNKIDGWVKASISTPECADQDPANYVVIDNGEIGGDLTTWPTTVYSGPVGGTRIFECTIAAPAKSVPTFTFNRWNYDQSTYHEFASVGAFHTWLTGAKDALEGTFVINEPCPAEADRIDLSGSSLAGNVTVITNTTPCPDGTVTGARVYIDGIDDDALPAGETAEFIVVTHHNPPADASCEINADDDCAISAKNDFHPDCRVAVLLYADNGSVAVKNNTDTCGSVIGDSIVMKNSLKLTYDSGFDRVLGFGPTTYEIARWEDRPA